MRVNDAFYETAHLTKGRFKLLPINLADAVATDERADLLASIQEAVDTGRIVVCRAHWSIHPQEEGAESLELQLRMRVIAKAPERCILCAIVQKP